MKTLATDRHFVYRHFNAAGDLLYVGATSKLDARLRDFHANHAQRHEIARTEVVEYPTRDEAFAAERAAINTLRPPWNTQATQPTATRTKEDQPMPLEEDYTLEEVAAALRMSTRWVRDRIKDGAEHTRRGHKIMFTAEQVESLRASDARVPAAESITTGRKKRAS